MNLALKSVYAYEISRMLGQIWNVITLVLMLFKENAITKYHFNAGCEGWVIVTTVKRVVIVNLFMHLPCKVS